MKQENLDELEDFIDNTNDSNIDTNESNDLKDNLDQEDMDEFDLEDDIDDFENESNDNSISYTPFLLDLKENNIIDLPEEFSDEDVTDLEYFRDVLEANLEGKIEQEIETRLDGLSDKTKKMIQLELEGNDISSLFEDESLFIDYNNVDLEDEENQKQLIFDLYSKKGFSETKINKLINKFEDSGELEEEANEAIQELHLIQQDEIEEYEESLVYQKQLKEQEEFDSYNTIVNTISNTEEISGIKLTPQRRSDLIKYITEPVAKDENGRVYTQDELDNYSVEDKIKNAFFRQNKLTNFEHIKKELVTTNSKKMEQEINKSKFKTSIKQDRHFGRINLPTIEARDTI